MLAWSHFMLMSTVLYSGCILLLAFVILPKLRANAKAYIYDGQRNLDQNSELTDEEKKAIEEAKNTAGKRKEQECSICLEDMVKNKVVLLCAHAYCASCIILYIKSQNLMQVVCPQCRKTASRILITDEGPEGPTQDEKQFIEKYNVRVFENRGFILFLENLPFFMHRYLSEVIDTCGLNLLTNPTFYIVTIIVLSSLSENFLDWMFELLAWLLDYIELGTIICVILPITGQLANWQTWFDNQYFGGRQEQQ